MAAINTFLSPQELLKAMGFTNFRVIISGGGIAGLTLAGALEKAKVDYVLLEGRDEIAPVVGAGIALMATGSRILDQLKCFEPIMEMTQPIDSICAWKDGKLFGVKDFPALGAKRPIRTGYPVIITDRHFLLQTLYNSIEDKSRILPNKRVSRVDHCADRVVVQCQDESTYTGDVVVGADGVHSTIRDETRRHMDISQWTPNTGLGGGHAIETAATTANVLQRLAYSKTPPTQKEVEEALQKVPEKQKPRTKEVFTPSNRATRFEALKGNIEYFMVLNILPLLGDLFVNKVASITVGSDKIEFLPDPPTCFTGTMAFNPNYGPGTKSHFGIRVLLALPFLLLAFVARTIFTNVVAEPDLQSHLGQILTSGQIEFHGQRWGLPTLVKPFDSLVASFSPSLLNIDPLQRIQMLSFLIDLGPLWLIYTLEAYRRANIFKPISLPILLESHSKLTSPPADYAALDWRLVNVAAARTAMMAIILSLTVPTFAMYLLPDLTQRLSINVIWQAFPILTSMVHGFLQNVTVDSTNLDRIFNVEADLPHTRFAIKVLAAVSALTFNWARFFSNASTSQIFLPSWNDVKSVLDSEAAGLDLVSGMRLCLQIDEIVCFVSAYLWLALLVHDLKEAEMTNTSWIQLGLCAGIGTYLAGPGAVVAVGWLWREGILATKKAKGAVVPSK
ncbi:uncharacterized protein Z518_04380 [Rhinocladiella mackenziei CBS 650.93]|uniref:Rhinocladiella mackenziei CBS 650.93 unplaced genomic scaffold supercont1.3, whole genome shotgun sequence n=1 Tax=Rhinocladiella mackenziei CBS 650.93 TaxID=1442369 RepID=A0A0D2IL24_9EURO|nr:uncharacterized protein Z518_04380 [Rhinocladiella mackenziei CBS 650.93]KIX06404.1 hypothetical protein Z518_04380 [Rhinocladiella mackenziei CBS 650.93]